MVFAPIFGYLGDRYSRKYVMAIGIFIWSATTFLGSLVNKDVSMLTSVFTVVLIMIYQIYIVQATHRKIAPNYNYIFIVFESICSLKFWDLAN